MTRHRDSGELCIARCGQPPHYLRTTACTHPATTEVGGHRVCGVHARVARRWQKEGRLDRMVAYWWAR